MDKKAKFHEIYANLPLGSRTQIVVIIDNEPLTWNSAKVEIDSNSSKTQEILDKLEMIGLLK